MLFLLSSLFIILALSSIQWLRQKYAVWNWQRRLKIKQHLATLDALSLHHDGFELSRQTRMQSDAYDYVYGEVNNRSFLALLSITQPDNATVFYDLGSGTGKAVLACAMVFDIKKACGIELFSNLHSAAVQQLDTLKQNPAYQSHTQKIVFVCDDFLNVNLEDATLIFISATGYFGDTWQQLNQHLAQLPQNPLIITTSKKLSLPQFQVVHQTRVQMSWGIVNAYMQRRLID